jgi:hypothetical protein
MLGRNLAGLAFCPDHRQTQDGIGWHRKGFRLFWTWKSRHGRRGRQLIRRMSRENPLWGAPRIHGELLKLGIDIGETRVGKYMVHRPKPPSQTWRTFLENHLKTLVSIDFLTVPTLRFQILYVFLVLAHDRRRILHFVVTAHPTAEWTAQQLREAFLWDSAPRFLLPDRDRIFGSDCTKQVEELGIEKVLGAAGAPQRAYIESQVPANAEEEDDHVFEMPSAEHCRPSSGRDKPYQISSPHLQQNRWKAPLPSLSSAICN